MQLFEGALIQCSCFPGHGRVSHWKRVIGVLDEDRKELIK